MGVVWSSYVMHAQMSQWHCTIRGGHTFIHCSCALHQYDLMLFVCNFIIVFVISPERLSMFRRENSGINFEQCLNWLKFNFNELTLPIFNMQMLISCDMLYLKMDNLCISDVFRNVWHINHSDGLLLWIRCYTENVWLHINTQGVKWPHNALII